MVEIFRCSVAIIFAGVVGIAGAANAQPAPVSAPLGDPPARVGRLAFLQGTVSFHDRDQSDWAPAVANTPLTSGDALWTEPNARSEVSIAGTRVRLDSGTQLDLLAIDDTQTRMQLDQGRLDIKTFTYDSHQPYAILTPRGTITLQQQGDYYVEAGSTQDPTRLGVRSGAAQIQAPNGQVLAVRAGEVGEIFDDNGSPQLRTIPSAPPPMPAYWAERDRTVIYDQPPQYVSAAVTGYEDLNGYGSWSNDSEYGYVWSPRTVVSGWEPYRTGQWSYVQPWGWTWVDEQPWASRPITTAAGPIATTAGSGCRRSAMSARSTLRRWSHSSAASNSVWRSASRAARRSAGSRSARVKHMCRPTRRTATTTAA